ncbi:SCP2 sterol-binding domain-containing protein [Thermus scotoductus]|uniref:Transcriptional regulator, Fis family n=1 Tax=Thermus scotoductus (strain ATCC 700910 / SA-01) TaxID=743525 RepID=E8PL61_THESS|nr:SCP2 sterol-binding domain-containing protein [Thermus scotoductus]ADW22285.1 transcriptional regulator, Fis family [Thermus scotoductus SA-01]
MYEPFSEEWAKAYGEALNANEAYRQAAATWEGALILAVEADPALGLPEKRGIYLDLYHGQCREARMATPQDYEQAPYVISADARTWKEITEGILDPISALMRGKLKLEKGDMAALAGYMMAALELTNTAKKVPTQYPEGL